MADYIVSNSISGSCDSTGLSTIVKKVSDLICKITGLQIIDTIAYGTEEFNGYPIYNQTPPGSKYALFETNAHQSDIYILGTDTNNYCLTVNIYNGLLLLGMGCSKEYGNRYNKKLLELYPESDLVKQHNPLTLSTRSTCGLYSLFDGLQYNASVVLQKDDNNIVNLTVAYYKGELSQGLKFVVNDTGSPWTIFTSGSDSTKFAILNFDDAKINSSNFCINNNGSRAKVRLDHSPLVIPFGRAIPLYDAMFSSSTYSNPNLINKLVDNAPFVPDTWCSPYFITSFKGDQYSYCHVAATNTINLYTYMGMCYNSNTFFAFTDYLINSPRIAYTPLNSLFNLPKLKPGQVYLRRLYAPNSNQKLNFYLWYSPVRTTPPVDAFYKVGNDVFFHCVNSMIGYAVKV